MAILRDPDDLREDGSGAVPFKRHFLLPGVVMNGGELVLVGLPLWSMFHVAELELSTIWRLIIPVLLGAGAVWFAAMAAWLAPVRAAVNLRRRGERIPAALATRAHRATYRIPLRALLLRTSLWIAAALAVGLYLVRYAQWPVGRAGELAAIAGMHGFALAVVRALWLAGVLASVRARVFARVAPLRRFGDGYFGRAVLVAAAVTAGTIAATATFLYYFLPITHDQYLQIFSFLPPAAALGLIGWILLARRASRDLEAFLAAAQGGEAAPSGVNATAVYRNAQSLPYRLALLHLALWLVVVAAAALVARWRLGFALDDTVVMAGISVVVGVGALIYASLAHRETVAPLLSELTMRYRLPVRGIRPSLSLRTKLLLSFGGVVLLACGMALFWGFVQYKNLVTAFVDRQADLGLSWLRSEVQAETASEVTPPTTAVVRRALQSIGKSSAESSAVYYYWSEQPGDPVASTGGGPMGAPPLPWYVRAQLALRDDGGVTLGNAGLTGRHGRLTVGWHGRPYDLGSVAVLYPNYRGRGESLVRPLRELFGFFVALFGACAGIVLVTVSQFVKPIRMLEQRADGMARGELADPVSSGGEGDEVGRLTFALEEMRRALRDKLRSTEEVNLDLERAVQRRTADLAKKNRELAETLDKLTRTQAQLVRSEKMASIGQLVAGIAHEINNPVNAIVNTVGPLEEAIGDLASADADRRVEAASDIRDMVRVVQRGAQRTKAIVSALHNYSRTDDESVVEFDLNRSIDDTLELLRHVLKHDIAVERRFGAVGRLRGHAGQINQVFMNLLTNAAHALAGREHAAITVETSARGEDVVVRVSDNGHGIAAEVLPRIFDPFFTTKDVGEGTGLGLSIVHELVERHGGTIEVESTVGIGTTFTVALPRKPDLAASTSREMAAAAAAREAAG